MNWSFVILAITGVCFSVAYSVTISRAMVGVCETPGQRIGDSDNITIYYLCALPYDNGSWHIVQMSCPSGAYFNTTYNECLETTMPTTTPVMPTTTPVMATTTPLMTTTTPLPTTTSPGYTCPNVGLFPDPFGKCTSYYQCQLVNGIWYYYIYYCPKGTYYDVITQKCQVGKCQLVILVYPKTTGQS